MGTDLALPEDERMSENTLNEFQNHVSSRWKLRGETSLFVMACGLGGESGEVLELLKKHVRDGKHPGESLLLELGDLLYYLTRVGQEYGHSLSDIMSENIEKLRKRDAKK